MEAGGAGMIALIAFRVAEREGESADPQRVRA
jgi:hypothetical protein